MTADLARRSGGVLVAGDMAEAFGAFLRLHVADGDASPHTLRAYMTHAAQYAAWCQRAGIDPRTVDETAITDYRRHLVAGGYTRGTIARKLAAVRRLYAAL